VELGDVPLIHSRPQPDANVTYTGGLLMRASRKGVLVPVDCAVYGGVGFCDGSVTLRSSATLVARTPFHLAAGSHAWIVLSLAPASARRLERRRLLEVSLRLENTFGESSHQHVVLAAAHA
jgi:hypothetical protein